MVEKVFYTEQGHCDHSLDEVESTAYHPCSGGVAGIVSHNSLLSIKDLAVAISTRARPAEDDPMLYK